MLVVTVEQTSLAETHRYLSGVEGRVSDLRPAMEEISEDFYRHEERAFGTEGSILRSGKWAPLSPRYAAWKARHYPGRTILVRTGKLKASLTQPGAEGAIREVTEDGLEIGTSISYARYHQWGTGRMPARLVIDPPPVVVEGWVQIVERYVEGQL
jgi:phage gpG-like protein